MFIKLKSLDEKIKDLLTKTTDEQRFLYYSGKINQKSDYECCCETEGEMFFAFNFYKIFFVKKMFLKKTQYKGFSFKKNKLIIWSNTEMTFILNTKEFIKFCEIIGCEWFSNLIQSKYKIKEIISKTILEKILTKKITNKDDLIKHYLKYNLKYKNVSHTLFYEFITTRYNELQSIKQHLKVVKNINHYLEYVLKHNSLPLHFHDIVKQCLILNKQVDIKWSENRFKHEHNEMTKEIMLREIEFVENKTIDYGNKIPILMPEMKILTSQREIFQEGTEMKHCIYTNYLNSILNKRYIVISYKGEQRATIGIRVHGDYCSFDQIQGIGNSGILYSITENIKSWFNSQSLQFSEFARDLNNIITIDTNKNEINEDEFAF